MFLCDSKKIKIKWAFLVKYLVRQRRKGPEHLYGKKSYTKPKPKHSSFATIFFFGSRLIMVSIFTDVERPHKNEPSKFKA